MYYKDLSNITQNDSNCVDNDAVANQYEQILITQNKSNIEDQPPENLDYFINTLMNFENSMQPEEDIKTICDFAKKNKRNLDDLLPNCNSIQRMIADLHSKNQEYVLCILTSLYYLSQNSIYTLYNLCNEIGLFAGLLEYEHVSAILIPLSNLLFKVVKFDNEEINATWNLVRNFNFVKKIIDILDSKIYNNPQITIILINCISCVFEKLSNTQLREFVDGVKLIETPLSNIQTYIISEDSSVLISVLKCYRIILVKWSGKLEQCLPDEVFFKFIKLIQNALQIDESGQALEETINIINVFIHFYTLYPKESDQVKISLIISSLISQLYKSKKCALSIINCLGRVAKYKSTACVLFQQNYLQFLISIYDELNTVMKLDLAKVFLYATFNFASEVIDKCKNIDNIFLDTFDSLSDDSYVNSDLSSLFFKALFAFFSADDDKINLFDGNELFDFLIQYEPNENEGYCRRILDTFYSSNDHVDPEDLFI